MRKVVGITLAFGLISSLFAEPNIPLDKSELKTKMEKIAGVTSPFNRDENFPKDYFLVPKNLPFAIGITLHHPRSSELGLSKEQIEKILELKKSKMGAIVKSAKEIKGLEFRLLSMLEAQEGKVKEVTKEMNDLVDEIAKKKAELTKGHLQCVVEVQNILTKEQRMKVGEIIGAEKHGGGEESKKKSEIDYLELQKRGEEVAMGLLKSMKPMVVESLKVDKSGVEGVILCSQKAQEMTKNYNESLKDGWSVRRTAIKYRNPENRPDRVDLAVMEKIIKDGNFSKPLITDVNSTHRVYIPLVTKKPCLACHGDKIDSKTKEEITKRYPEDLAVGFKEGQFRGVIVAEFKDSRECTR